jgi:hypothetical protein
MKRTSGLIVMALGLLVLRGAAFSRAMQTVGPTTIHASHSKTHVVPAEDSGGDDSGDDGSDAGDAD